MTTYRLFPATNGPSALTGAGTGAFIAGVVFKVTAAAMWFEGYWWWVPPSGDTGAQKFALWNVTGSSTGSLVTAATVTSGTLTANSWNFVSLAAPVPLAIGTAYIACTGWTVVHGFPDSDSGSDAPNSYGTGGHTAGITSGPLTAFSDRGFAGGTNLEPYGIAQGLFNAGHSDPAVTMPTGESNAGNFWVDVSVSDTAPASYPGAYRLWPGKADANAATVPDSAIAYSVATEFRLSQPCTLGKIWYYSPAGTAQLATRASIWRISDQSELVVSAAPSWSAAAGSGWVSCSFAGVTLAADSYKVAVYNGAASPDGWSAKDASTGYWATGDGASGITWGPISAPGLSAASLAFEYNGNAGGTPPFSNGVQEKGQCTFFQGPPNAYPNLYVDGLAQNYWVDAEVTPATSAPAGAATGTGTGRTPLAAITVTAGLASGTGAARNAIVNTSGTTNAPAGLASGTGTGRDATTVHVGSFTVGRLTTGTGPGAGTSGTITSGTQRGR